jgi:uncharacterized protein
MASPEFFVPARDLDAAGRLFRFPLRTQWLRGALEGTQIEAGPLEGALEVRLSKSGTDVVLRGTVAAHVVAPCARCLEPAKIAIREPLSALFVAGRLQSSPRRHAAEQANNATDEADVIPYDGETVVMDGLVRDEILLGVPMIPLCSEACAGIRPQASDRAPDEGHEEIDPRLRPLLGLAHKT